MFNKIVIFLILFLETAQSPNRKRGRQLGSKNGQRTPKGDKQYEQQAVSLLKRKANPLFVVAFICCIFVVVQGMESTRVLLKTAPSLTQTFQT